MFVSFLPRLICPDGKATYEVLPIFQLQLCPQAVVISTIGALKHVRSHVSVLSDDMFETRSGCWSIATAQFFFATGQTRQAMEAA